MSQMFRPNPQRITNFVSSHWLWCAERWRLTVDIEDIDRHTEDLVEC